MAISYDVPLVAQTSNMSCWAASIAMILGWKRQQSIPDTEIARNPGGLNYMPAYKSGLDPNDKYILSANGFETDPPQCYMPQYITRLMRSYGPLWVATLAPNIGPHIRVVRAIDGETLQINDPWPVDVGAQYSKSFSDFFGTMEDLGSRELKEPNPVYVAYLVRG